MVEPMTTFFGSFFRIETVSTGLAKPALAVCGGV
jgi:hypothetical protein